MTLENSYSSQQNIIKKNILIDNDTTSSDESEESDKSDSDTDKPTLVKKTKALKKIQIVNSDSDSE